MDDNVKEYNPLKVINVSGERG